MTLFRRRLLGQYPAAPCSPGPFVLLLTYPKIPPNSGKSKTGALKWGLKATLSNLRAIVYNCALLWPFGAPF